MGAPRPSLGPRTLTEHLLVTGHARAKGCELFNSRSGPERGILQLPLPVSQMRKGRLREVERLAQGRTAGKWENYDYSPGPSHLCSEALGYT